MKPEDVVNSEKSEFHVPSVEDVDRPEEREVDTASQNISVLALLYEAIQTVEGTLARGIAVSLIEGKSIDDLAAELNTVPEKVHAVAGGVKRTLKAFFTKKGLTDLSLIGESHIPHPDSVELEPDFDIESPPEEEEEGEDESDEELEAFFKSLKTALAAKS